MKIKINRFIPFHGFAAMAFFNVIFIREEYDYLINTSYFKKIINHESIHEAQMRDFCKWLPLGGFIFYIWYVIEWLIRVLFIHPFSRKAYRTIKFEQEAYKHEADFNYLNTRKKFNWLK